MTSPLIYLLFFLLCILIISRLLGSSRREGFTVASEKYVVKTGGDIFDDFYANIYDYIWYNNVTNEYEIGEIVRRTGVTRKSRVLEINCRTGHHLELLRKQEIPAEGIEENAAVLAQAKKNYPKLKIRKGAPSDTMEFQGGLFTHILCLSYGIYYIPDRLQFFRNCFHWLMPGGYLVVHMVNRNLFDTLLPGGNPLQLVSAQKFSKDRINHTEMKFDDFSYSADWDVDVNASKSVITEKFVDHSGNVRENRHELAMPIQREIVSEAKKAGFILLGKAELIEGMAEYQYLYILQKPE